MIWLDVKDMLPGDGKDVLVCRMDAAGDKEYSVTRYFEKSGFSPDVIAWYPIAAFSGEFIPCVGEYMLVQTRRLAAMLDSLDYDCESCAIDALCLDYAGPESCQTRLTDWLTRKGDTTYDDGAAISCRTWQEMPADTPVQVRDRKDEDWMNAYFGAFLPKSSSPFCVFVGKNEFDIVTSKDASWFRSFRFCRPRDDDADSLPPY